MIYDVDCDPDDAKDRWRECMACGCPIGDTDELCRSLTCHLYGKRAIAPLVNARSDSTKGDLITAFSSSGEYDGARSAEWWARLCERYPATPDPFGPIEFPVDSVDPNERST